MVRAAGVSTSSFYKHFANADECFAAALDMAVDQLLGDLGRSRLEADWRQSLKAIIGELLSQFGANQTTARVGLVDSFAAGPSTRKRVGITAMRVEGLLAGCFSGPVGRMSTPRHLITGMTGGVLRVLRTTVVAGRAHELPRLADPLADWLVSLADPAVISLPTPNTKNSTGRTLPNLGSLLAGNPADDRIRLLRTVMRLAAEGGFGSLTAPGVRRDAGVPRRQFDRLFDGVDQCFLEAVDVLVESVATESNHSAVDNWTRRSHESITTLCASAAENRRLARVALLEVFAPGHDGLMRREQLIGRGAEALRRTIPVEERPSRLVAEASVAAAWHVAQADVNAGRTRSLPSVAPLLSYLVLAPIVGAKPAVAAIRAEAQEGELAAA